MEEKNCLAALCDEAFIECNVINPNKEDCVPVSKTLTRIINERYPQWKPETKIVFVLNPNDDSATIDRAWVSLSIDGHVFIIDPTYFHFLKQRGMTDYIESFLTVTPRGMTVLISNSIAEIEECYSVNN